MGRPKGMYRDNQGLWRYADGTLTPNSAAKVNGTATTAAAEPVTASVIFPPVIKQEPKKVQGVKMYTPDEIQKIEAATGLIFQGWMADGSSAALVPVFVRADHNEEKRAGILADMRKGG